MRGMTRVAIVTGGGRGIGAAIAVALARTGVQVAVTARTAKELARSVDIIEAAGGRALAVTADLASPAAVERMVVEATRRLGPVDILVNNAGVAESCSIANTDDALWDRHLLVNLTAAFWLCRAVAPQMASRGWGRIVNVSSATAERAVPFSAAYSASKAGLVGLTRALAAELGPRGVTVNAVCPAWVDTAMATHAVERAAARTGRPPETVRTEILARAQQGRFLVPDEVASVVGYLASEEACAVNGQSWMLDGSAPRA